MNLNEESLFKRGMTRLVELIPFPALIINKKKEILHLNLHLRRFLENGKSPKYLDDLFEDAEQNSHLLPHKLVTLKTTNGHLRVTCEIIPFSTSAGDELYAVLINSRNNSPGSDDVRTTHIIYSQSDLIFQFDELANVYFVSNNAEQITGYPASDFISGKLHPIEIVHPEDRKQVREQFEKIVREHVSVENITHRIIKKDGSIAYLLKSWYPIFDDKRNFIGIIGLNKDITKEKELEEKTELFHSAFMNSTDAIVITNTDGTIIEVNDAFTKIYGFSREEAIGKTTRILKSRHSTPELYRQMWNSLNRYDQWKGEIINRCKDGREVPVWTTITPIYLKGKKIGYMGIESDISEKKNLEQQIIQTEKLATVGQLSAGIAHEIGTPLNIISGNAEFLLMDMTPEDKGYNELLAIVNQTKRITRLIRQILDFARPKIISLQPVDLNTLIKDVLEFVHLQFEKNKIEIKTNFSQDLPLIYGDPALLYQVFLNIIVNSFHAMPAGGDLQIETEADKSNSGEEKVTIIIRDTGEGIPPENLQKIFTPFFTTKEPGKGTGLGLAVTKRILQEHNGTIEISSETGRGTVATIRLDAMPKVNSDPGNL
ncbi:MAG: PAS domain-containing sensor histidine kinase [Candidatus Kryptoniota bacterium]